MNEDENQTTKKEEKSSIVGQPEQPSPLRMSCITSKLTHDANPNSALTLFSNDFYFQLLVEANVYFELEMIDESSKRLEVYLKQFPEYAKGLNMIGLCYWLNDNFGAAIAAMEKACRIEPENSDYLADLINLLDSEGMNSHALEKMRGYMSQFPKKRFEFYTTLRAYEIDHRFIQLAWKTRKQSKLKVLNGNPIKNGSPMKK